VITSFLNINILRKTAVLHLAHFCGWGCTNSSLQFIGHNCTCSLLGLELCQTQARSLFDTAVLTYSALHSPLLTLMFTPPDTFSRGFVACIQCICIGLCEKPALHFGLKAL
jgi:hypothetical protein